MVNQWAGFPLTWQNHQEGEKQKSEKTQKKSNQIKSWNQTFKVEGETFLCPLQLQLQLAAPISLSSIFVLFVPLTSSFSPQFDRHWFSFWLTPRIRIRGHWIWELTLESSSSTSMATVNMARSRPHSGGPAKENLPKLEESLNAFRSGRFDPDSYVQSKCSLNEKVRPFSLLYRSFAPMAGITSEWSYLQKWSI